MQRLQFRKGFTLLELLIVIGIVAILAGVVFVALDPLTRFRDARNARRYADVSAILTAIRVDQVDNGGQYISAIQSLTPNDTTNYMIGTDAGSCASIANCAVTTAAACIDLTGLQTEGYVGIVPVSPQGSGTWNAVRSGYYLRRNTNNSITIGACESEGAPAIQITR